MSDTTETIELTPVRESKFAKAVTVTKAFAPYVAIAAAGFAINLAARAASEAIFSRKKSSDSVDDNPSYIEE